MWLQAGHLRPKVSFDSSDFYAGTLLLRESGPRVARCPHRSFHFRGSSLLRLKMHRVSSLLFFLPASRPRRESHFSAARTPEVLDRRRLSIKLSRIGARLTNPMTLFDRGRSPEDECSSLESLLRRIFLLLECEPQVNAIVPLPTRLRFDSRKARALEIKRERCREKSGKEWFAEEAVGGLLDIFGSGRRTVSAGAYMPDGLSWKEAVLALLCCPFSEVAKILQHNLV